tara:strand:+ start:10091 stop:11623 length:1533 start_codon:yes stop_codon:yes gene_type:complete
MSKKIALVSVFNKEGVVDLVNGLVKHDFEILSTGGTAKLLRKGGIDVIDVSDYTGQEEILGGRVKTLHPKVFGGILATDDKKHQEEIEELGIKKLDLVVVNLYPFEETIGKGSKLKEILENIDIGGHSLMRAAAKNFNEISVLSDPEDYASYLEVLEEDKVDDDFRADLAAKAFMVAARYDTIISRFFAGEFLSETFPEIYNSSFKKIQDLRYGENPHQQGAFYRSYFVGEACVGNSKQIQGKQLSYNNILDANDAFELVKEFKEPVAAVIKHTNPSGVATADDISEAYKRAHENDPLSAFGCIVALNRDCDKKTAEYMKGHFVEVIICPKFDKEALEVLGKKKKARLLETGPIKQKKKTLEARSVVGGILYQTREFFELEEKDLEVATKRKPTKDEIRDMVFAWKVTKHTKSNSIVFAKDNVTTGIGAGQMSRVDAVKLAVMKSEGKCEGSVMSSDAFFPFRDGVDEAAKAGVTAIIQPGGSIRDEEAINAANENDIAMVFTGKRLFKH